MENLGREMVKKCGGLPLAIIALRGILATKDSLDDWNLVYKNVGKYWGKEGDREYLSLKAHLALSYLELPSYLKPCLLHLSQFPEDFSIPTKMLFRLWIAEGIVATTSLNGEETLEDIAKGYLKELVDRSVVQIGKRGSSGKIKSCHLHDLIRELSLSKAKQENYLEIVVGDAKIHSTAHRVVVHTTTNNVIDFDKKSRVRSFIGPWKLQTLQESELMIGEFHMLRVLILKNTLGKWINEIGKLIHLKYLSLDRCGIEYLPSSLRNFRYLQTLFFKTNPGQKKLKISNRIWNFQELSHLEIDCSQCSSKCNDNHLDLGNLRNLRTLRTIGPIYAKGLEKLTNLQKLTTKLEKKDRLKLIQSEYLNGLATLQIGFDSCETIYEKDLERLLLSCGQLNEKELERLFSGCGQLKKLKLDGKIEKLPEYNQNFTPNLTKLTLFNSELKEDPMHVLEKLPELTFLKLFKAFDGEKMVFSSKGFSQLKTLFLDCLDKVMEWQVDEGAMASLCHLRIACCSKLKMVPEGIKYTTNTLSQLDIFGMPYQFCNRVRMIDGEEGEDYYKVRHVPSITILRELW